MAEAAVLSGLQWAASTVVKELLADASTYLRMDMAQELEELEATILPQFELVIEAAEKSPHKRRVEKWLKELKNAFYEAEDLLDEYNYSLLERNAKREELASQTQEFGVRFAQVCGAVAFLNCVKEFDLNDAILGPLLEVSNRLPNLLPKNKKLLQQLNVLKNILAKAKDFRQLLGIQVLGDNSERSMALGTQSLTKTSFPSEKMFGRDMDRDRVIDLLCKPTTDEDSTTCYLSLALVGHGGAGKTTLAQYVYHDDRVVQHFDVKMWVSISRKLDVSRHTREIIESATKGECPRVDNLDTLQYKLREILIKSEKFLLVLDDVWLEESNGDNEEEWELLLAPLTSQLRGSKVLVTSRSTTLPAALHCKEYFPLEDMEETEFSKLFRHHAFAGAQIRDPQLRERLEVLGERTARKLGRSPLAAKAVGHQLSKKLDCNTWTAILQKDNLSETREVLLWSYQRLDPHLQRCFLYCSLFPKGHRYKADELVHLWLAEGLVNLSDQNSRFEDIVEKYFDEFVSGSFFQPVSDRFSGTWYTMHDLFHDLAERLSAEDYFRLDDDKVAEIPFNVRHLSVQVESMQRHKVSICKLQHLRTVICIVQVMDDVNELFQEIFQNLKKLRVLCLCFHNNSRLPESVSELKHLRYLNLIRTSIIELPESLCSIYHLQLLQLNNKVKNLPNKLCNLSKLRYLEGYDDLSYRMFKKPLPQIPNIGKLTSLRHIDEFCVRKQKGYELRQLRNKNELGGSLRITNLENVSTKDEALESMLNEKIHLEGLEFVWSGHNELHTETNFHLEVIEGLMPPSQLTYLAIKGYKAATYPSWLLRDSCMEHLESFALENCCALEGLPPNFQLFMHCQRLSLVNVPNLKELPYLPAGLKDLRIAECPLLTFISQEELKQHNQSANFITADSFTSRFVSIVEAEPETEMLMEVLLADYSSLKQFMVFMGADISEDLQTIGRVLDRDVVLEDENIVQAWSCCQEQRMKLIFGRSIEAQIILPSALCELDLSSCSITDGALATSLSGLTALRRLRLVQIMTLSSLPPEQVLQQLTVLSFLLVQSCWCLRSLGGIRALTSLQNFGIISCPSLELAHEHGTTSLPSSLECLSVKQCLLAAGFLRSDLPRLKQLLISGCRGFSSLSVSHLSSLEEFGLSNCPDLCLLEGLSSLRLPHVRLINVPKLAAESFSQCQGWKSLAINSSAMLNCLLLIEGLVLPEHLCFQGYHEPSVTFESSLNFTSVKSLEFFRSKMKCLPINLKIFSSLQIIEFIACPYISSFPDLPNSVQQVKIWNCEALRESCRAPDGENWPKIAHIRWKNIR